MPAIDIIQGGNWGSEAKGAIAGYFAERKRYDWAVRTGAINAGHTVYYKGKPYVCQQLPVAWVSPYTQLVIGPGAYIHVPTLNREIMMVNAATGEDVTSRLWVDKRAGVHLDSYAAESASINRHHKIGATGKGCAEAIVHKIKDRGDADLLLIDYIPKNVEVGWRWTDTADMLSSAYDKGAKIQLEGTQGELLDFHLGPWPYVTSRQTTAAAWVAEAGLSPSLEYNIILVVRQFPIRVAGNSGPMPHEITWPQLAWEINLKLDEAGMLYPSPLRVAPSAIEAWERAVRQIGEGRGVDLLNHPNMTAEERVKYKDVLSEYSNLAMEMVGPIHEKELKKLFEFTTVTKKLRRIARLDWEDLGRTIRRLKPDQVVLTFLNYQYPELHCAENIHDEAMQYVKAMCPQITHVQTGPESHHVHPVI